MMQDVCLAQRELKSVVYLLVPLLSFGTPSRGRRAHVDAARGALRLRPQASDFAAAAAVGERPIHTSLQEQQQHERGEPASHRRWCTTADFDLGSDQSAPLSARTRFSKRRVGLPPNKCVNVGTERQGTPQHRAGPTPRTETVYNLLCQYGVITLDYYGYY